MERGKESRAFRRTRRAVVASVAALSLLAAACTSKDAPPRPKPLGGEVTLSDCNIPEPKIFFDAVDAANDAQAKDIEKQIQKSICTAAYQRAKGFIEDYESDNPGITNRQKVPDWQGYIDVSSTSFNELTRASFATDADGSTDLSQLRAITHSIPPYENAQPTQGTELITLTYAPQADFWSVDIWQANSDGQNVASQFSYKYPYGGAQSLAELQALETKISAAIAGI